jgi:hypothetical protein
MPYSVAVFIPPDFDREYTRCWGFELEDIYAFGLHAVRTKWRAIGYPFEEMSPAIFPVDHSLDPKELAARQIRLLEAHVLGPPNGRPDSNPEIQELFFEIVARSADTGAVNGRPFTVQWRFADADPWHVVVENGSTRAEPGESPAADLTFETTWADWISISKGLKHPARALLERKVRVHGGPRQLLTFARAFPNRS